MIVGLPKEIKDNEYRVGLTPAGVRALTDAGHQVIVEKSAGEGSGFEDALYQKAGAEIIDSADEVWARAEMIVKVKEPIEPEYPRMREGQLLFTYLHLAPDTKLTQELLKRKVTGIAYETITDRRGGLAAADADVGSCRTHGDPGRRPLSREDEWRPRNSAGRRAGCAGSTRRDHRRRCGRNKRREDCCRHGRARDHHRQQSRSIARA